MRRVLPPAALLVVALVLPVSLVHGSPSFLGGGSNSTLRRTWDKALGYFGIRRENSTFVPRPCRDEFECFDQLNGYCEPALSVCMPMRNYRSACMLDDQCITKFCDHSRPPRESKVREAIEDLQNTAHYNSTAPELWGSCRVRTKADQMVPGSQNGTADASALLCSTTSDCPSAAYCGTEGICQARRFTQEACQENVECAEGLLCVSGSCQLAASTSSSSDLETWGQEYVVPLCVSLGVLVAVALVVGACVWCQCWQRFRSQRDTGGYPAIGTNVRVNAVQTMETVPVMATPRLYSARSAVRASGAQAAAASQTPPPRYAEAAIL